MADLPSTSIDGGQLPDFSSIYKTPNLPAAHMQYDNAVGVLDTTLLKSIVGDYDQLAKEAGSTAAASTEEITKQGAIRSELMDATGRREQIDKYPRMLTGLMGLFDSDWNWEAQNSRVRAAKEGLATSDDYLSRLQMLHQLQSQFVTDTITKKKLMYDSILQGYDRGLKTREAMTVEEHYQTDLAFRKQSMGLAFAQDARERRKMAMEEDLHPFAVKAAQFDQLRQQVTDMTPEQLDALQAGGGVGAGIAFERKMSLRQMQQGIESSDIAMESGHLTLAKQYQMEALLTQPATSLNNLLSDAEKNGFVELPTLTTGKMVKVPYATIQEALAAQVASSKTAAATLGDKLQAAVLLGTQDTQGADGSTIPGFPGVDSQYVQEAMAALMTATGGTVSPDGKTLQGVPLELEHTMQQGLAVAHAKYAAGDYPGTVKALDDMVKAFDAGKMDYIKNNYTSSQQPWVTQLATPGSKPTADAAVSFLGSSVLQPGVFGFGNDSKYFQIAQKIKDTVIPLLRQSGGGFDPSVLASGGDPMTAITLGTGLKYNQIVQQAIGESGAQDMFITMRDKMGLNMMIQRFREAGAKDSWMKDVFDSNSSVFLQDPTKPADAKLNTGQTNQMSLPVFLARMRIRYEQDVADGKIKPEVQPYNEQVLQYLQSNELGNRMHDYFVEGLRPEGKALTFALFGNNPMVDWEHITSQATQDWMQFYSTEKAVQARRQMLIDQAKGVFGAPTGGKTGQQTIQEMSQPALDVPLTGPTYRGTQ